MSFLGGFLPNAFGDMRQDFNMLLQHDWAESAAATARQSDERAMNRSMEFNSAEAIAQRDFAERMSSTAFQRGVKDMEAAGINPMLAAKVGGADSPGGASATVSGTKASPAQIPSGGPSNAHVNSAQIALMNAQTDKTVAEAGEVKARTPTHAANIELTKQHTLESVERVEKLMAEVNKTRQDERTSAASQFNLEQQTRNLKETVEHIRMSVSQLRQQTMLTGSQDAEIRQRINSNLPQIERALKELEEMQRKLGMPQRMNDAGLQDSWLGALSRLLQAFNPLLPFMR